MQITETLSEGLKRELKVVIDAKELDERLNARLDELKGKVRLSGFRPGKVPIAHIKKLYGRSVMAEVLEQTIEETSTKAISERKERPAARPSVSLVKEEGVIEGVMDSGHDLEFMLAFEVLPTITLADLKSLTVEKPVAAIGAEQIDKALDRLREGNLAYDAKDGEAANGDRVTIDYAGSIDGEPFEGGAAQDADVNIGGGMFIPGFEEGLSGAKAGDKRTVTANFPENYPAKHLAGKQATFEVEVKQVSASRMPDLNDDFAKTLGLDSLDKLKEILRDQMSKDFGRASRAKAKRSLLDVLDKAHVFELPPSLVDSEFEAIWGEAKRQLEQTKKNFEDEGTTEDKMREEYRTLAERRVRLGLVISEIGTTSGITVTDEEVRRAIMDRARNYPGQERQVLEFYQKNPGAQVELRAPIFEDKVVDYALELVKVDEKPVSVEELFKPDPEDEAHEPEHVHGPDCNHDHDHHAHSHDHDQDRSHDHIKHDHTHEKATGKAGKGKPK